ncbi:MAG TPA: hypothetical protein VGS08_03100 [Candidatus Saccharimonadales bacterium]|nr:hypothetical protein [Candidatus Saccharimonadales bacterium]
MTVCIAAIYNNNSVLGASDKMLSTDDIEFEPTDPQAKKIFNITNSAAIMTAGGSNIHAQILPRVDSYVKQRLAKEPTKWIPIIDIANAYRDAYIELRKEIAERAILYPYDLNYKTFIEKQKIMNSKAVRDIAHRLEEFQFDYDEDIAAIIAGVDDTPPPGIKNGPSPHIYVFSCGRVSCNDNVGFAAVGIGARHALSHLMLLGHSRFASEPETLVRVHRSKKKAEVSPGVGEKTDMFVIGPSPGSFNMLEPKENFKADIVKDLDKSYESTYKKGLAKLDEADVKAAKDYLEKLFKENTPPQQASPTDHEINVSDETKTKKEDNKENERKEPTGRTRRKTN